MCDHIVGFSKGVDGSGWAPSYLVTVSSAAKAIQDLRSFIRSQVGQEYRLDSFGLRGDALADAQREVEKVMEGFDSLPRYQKLQESCADFFSFCPQCGVAITPSVLEEDVPVRKRA